jgi:hypothetical protein
MFARVERGSPHRLTLSLIVAGRVNGKPRPIRLGSLGSVSAYEPLSASERVAFWAQLPARLAAIAERHPARIISAADTERVKAAIAERIPLPNGEVELQRVRTATALNDLVRALGAYDGNAAFDDALTRLAAVAREANQSERSKASNRKEQAG